MVYLNILRQRKMPELIDGKTYYRTAECCRELGVARNTFFRWLEEDDFEANEYRDWRGWRLVPEAQLSRMKEKKQQIKAQPKQPKRSKE
jgi:hypothetical protein